MKYLFSTLLSFLFCHFINAQTPIAISISNAVVDNGQVFELDVRTTGFSNVTNFQFSVNWDSAVLDFDTIVNYSTALPLVASTFNFTQNNQGRFGLYWFDVNAKTLPANDLLFKIKFKAIAVGNTVVSFANEPTDIFAQNTTGIVAITPTNGTVTVQIPGLVNDLCPGAISIQNLFGKGVSNPQTSTIFDNTNATTNSSEPATGHGCFYEETIGSPSGLDNSLWYKFTGDGKHYRITTVQCNTGANYITSGDAQMAVYKGSCGSLVPVACNEDMDVSNSNYAAQIADLGAEQLKDFYILIDGCRCIGNNNAVAKGQFCIQVEQLTTVGATESFGPSKLVLFPNPVTEQTMLQFELVENQAISIDLMDNTGQLVRKVLANAEMSAGIQNIPVSMAGLPAGLYLVVLNGTNGSEIVKATKI